MAYFFMMQTFDEAGPACFNETMKPELRLTCVRLLKEVGEGLTEGPCLELCNGILWSKGWSWDIDDVEELSDNEAEMTYSEIEEHQSCSTKIGGGIRWIQEGRDHPVNLDGSKMKSICELSAMDFPQLGLFVNYEGELFAFYHDVAADNGMIVWEST